MKEQEKKVYAAPTLVEYGKVEKKTLGLSGDSWEAYGIRPSDDNPIPPHRD